MRLIMENEEIKNEKFNNTENSEKNNEAKVAEVVENRNTQGSKKEDRKGLAIAAMVLGIVSIVFCCVYWVSIICAILAIIFGIVAIKSSGKGMAISGIVTGSIGIFISLFVTIFLIGISSVIYNEAVDVIKDNDWDDYEYNYDWDDSGYEYYFDDFRTNRT